MATNSESLIVRVVAGESHTLALTDDGKVFAWGKGLFGRLGNGSSSDQCVPTEIKFTVPFAHTQHALVSDGIQYPHPKITSIAAGAYHSLALTDEGDVWSWGYNIYGQLGHEDFNDAIPHPLHSQDLCKDAKNVSTVAGPEGEHVDGGGGDEIFKVSKVVMVEAGGLMSCAVDQCGVLWMWGHCPFPTNEVPEQPFMLSVCQTPRPVGGLQGLHVRKVACGNEHVLALVDSQYHCEQPAEKRVCYVWGSNTYGQLGLGDRESRVYPQRVQALDEQEVGTLIDVACGAYHSAVLTHNEGESGSVKRSSLCWTFGMGENGQLGHGSSQSLALPEMVESLPENERVMAVSCGLFHMGIVTEAGGVWIWGMERGLGLCPGIGPPGLGGGDYMFPVRVTGSNLFAASHGLGLACGAAHTVLAVNDGEHALWSWGRGQNGVLGTGQCVDSLTPCPVIWPPRNFAETTTAESHAKPSVFENSAYDYPLNQSPLAESGTAPLEQMLAVAQREICALATELAVTKKHHALLHAALYGPSESSNSWEILREWDRKVVETSYDDLVCLDNFYRQARSRVKEVLLQKKVEIYCKQLMTTLKSEVKDFVD